MGKGIILVLTKDKDGSLVLNTSVEFKRYMELDKYGKEVLNKLSNLNYISQFESMVSNLNKEHFNYLRFNLTHSAGERELVDLSENAYIKNLTDEPITISCRNGNFKIRPYQVMVTVEANCINNDKEFLKNYPDISLEKIDEQEIDNELEDDEFEI